MSCRAEIMVARARRNPVILANTDAIRSGYESGRTQKSLAIEYGVTQDIIHWFLKANNVEIRSWSESHRKYPLNQGVFDAVTDESAYWIGFLMADGCVSDGGDGRFTLSLSLAAQDAEHVEKFRNFLGSGQSVRIEPRSITTIRGRKFKQQSCARILIRSRLLVTALAAYGVEPRKSLTAQACGGIENNKHFWRGVVDGDGWISAQGNPMSLGLCGSRRMMEQFRSFVLSIVPKYRAGIAFQKPSHFQMKVSGRQAQVMIRHLYEDVPVSLDRKQELADAAIQTTFIDLFFPVRKDRIISLRTQQGLNQREAAKIAGLHYSFWNMIERNNRGRNSRLTRKTIDRICGALGCEPEAILAMKDAA